MFILKANSLQDKIFNGVKKQKSLEFQFDVLNAHWLQLKKRQITITLCSPHPMCYANDVCDKVTNSIIRSFSVYGFNFPFINIIVCSCGHFYHVWCVNIWFKKNTQCNLCGGLCTQIGTRVLDFQSLTTNWKASEWIWNVNLCGVW